MGTGTVDQKHQENSTGGQTPVPPSDAAAQRIPRSVLFIQFFIVPLAIVLMAVGIYLAFSWLSGQHRSAADLLKEIKEAGGKHRGELSRQFLQVLSRDQKSREDRALAAETLQVLSRVPNVPEEELTRCALTQTMGLFNIEMAIPLLKETLKDPLHSVRVCSIEALAMMKSESLVPLMLELIRHEDPAFRKRAAFALGKYKNSPEITGALKEALNDAREEVVWNAALVLAWQGDGSGTPALIKMLDREYVKGVVRTSMDEAKRTGIKIDDEGAYMAGLIDGSVLAAVRAVKYIKEQDPKLVEQLSRTAKADPSPDIRLEAQKILAEIRK